MNFALVDFSTNPIAVNSLYSPSGYCLELSSDAYWPPWIALQTAHIAEIFVAADTPRLVSPCKKKLMLCRALVNQLTEPCWLIADVSFVTEKWKNCYQKNSSGVKVESAVSSITDSDISFEISPRRKTANNWHLLPSPSHHKSLPAQRCQQVDHAAMLYTKSAQHHKQKLKDMKPRSFT